MNHHQMNHPVSHQMNPFLQYIQIPQYPNQWKCDFEKLTHQLQPNLHQPYAIAAAQFQQFQGIHGHPSFQLTPQIQIQNNTIFDNTRRFDLEFAERVAGCDYTIIQQQQQQFFQQPTANPNFMFPHFEQAPQQNQRWILKEELGQGSFSIIRRAYDQKLQKDVALKIEKQDKAKRILKQEFDFLKKLQGLPHIVEVFDFIEQSPSKLNFIVMDLKSHNLVNFKKQMNKEFTEMMALNLLQQVLAAIESVHRKGIVHRDIKPSNFVIGKKQEEKEKVFLVDFGLAKDHLNVATGVPIDPRRITDFRGTIPYASLNAHNKVELARRDDLWSFFFMMLEFLNEPLSWKQNTNKDQVREIKQRAFKNPAKLLYPSVGKKFSQVRDLFHYLMSLRYHDEPDYKRIRGLLVEMQHSLKNRGPNPKRELIMQQSLNHLQQVQMQRKEEEVQVVAQKNVPPPPSDILSLTKQKKKSSQKSTIPVNVIKIPSSPKKKRSKKQKEKEKEKERLLKEDQGELPPLLEACKKKRDGGEVKSEQHDTTTSKATPQEQVPPASNDCDDLMIPDHRIPDGLLDRKSEVSETETETQVKLPVPDTKVKKVTGRKRGRPKGSKTKKRTAQKKAKK